MARYGIPWWATPAGLVFGYDSYSEDSLRGIFLFKFADMRYVQWFFLFFITFSGLELTGLLHAQKASILITCTHTLFKAWHTEKKTDKKLKIPLKKLKQPILAKYAGFSHLATKSINLTDTKPVTVKISKMKNITLQLEQVVRASKKNTIILSRKDGTNAQTLQIKFEDRDTYIHFEGNPDLKADIYSALHCPLWP